MTHGREEDSTEESYAPQTGARREEDCAHEEAGIP
jgi:hypothetical protein